MSDSPKPNLCRERAVLGKNQPSKAHSAPRNTRAQPLLYAVFCAFFCLIAALTTGCETAETSTDTPRATNFNDIPSAKAIDIALPDPNEKHLLKKAEEHIKAGEWEQARKLLRDIVRKNPRQARAHAGLGQYYQHKKDITKAIHHYQRASRYDDADTFSRFELARVLHETGRTDEAIERLDQVQSITPNEPNAFAMRGSILLDGKRYPEAISSLEKARDLRPEHPETLDNLGSAYADSGQYDKAEETYRALLEVQPDNPTANYNLATVFHAMKRYEDALNYYDKASEQDPSNLEAIRLGRAVRRYLDAKQPQPVAQPVPEVKERPAPPKEIKYKVY